MYRNLGTQWASSLLGFLSVGFILIPFVLFFIGRGFGGGVGGRDMICRVVLFGGRWGRDCWEGGGKRVFVMGFWKEV